MKDMSNRAIKITSGFVFTLPILALFHETLVVSIASIVRNFFGSDAFYQFIRPFLASPVHAKIMTETLSGIQAKGVAIATWPGQILHQILPALFLEPELTTPGAWVSAVLDKESTVLSVLVTQSAAEMFLILLGALLLRASLRGRNLWDVLKHARLGSALGALLGLFIIAQAVWAMFALTRFPQFAGLRETGIGVGFSLLLQLDAARYNWLMDESLPILLPMALITAALGTAWLLGKTFDQIGARVARTQPAPRPTFIANQISLPVALALLLAISPVSQRYFGTATTHLLAPANPVAASEPLPQIAALPTLHPPTPTHTPTATPTLARAPIVLAAPTARFDATLSPTPSPAPLRPTQVAVHRVNGKFALVVNRQRTLIKGMNYNVNYTALPGDMKQRQHRRDFRIMRDAGVNAIIGWGVYDETTLEVAREFGIGVFMPFELDAQGAYKNLHYREQVRQAFQKFVKRFQHFPALWGWNPGGDELLHRMETEHHRTPDSLHAASDFLFELCESAYVLDPLHVSIVKEPRDRYVPYIEESVRKARLKPQAPDPNTFFIFAVNTYGKPDGIATLLRSTQPHVEDRIGIPMVIGEFAPFGLARTDRPNHYATIWNVVQQVSSIGGFAYVYGPDQPNPHAPNPYDPLRLLVNEFSLVDIDGNPVDGSLNALAEHWRRSSPLPRPLNSAKE